MTTQNMVKASFTIPELQDDKMISWNLHITKDLGTHDMIIGRDILELLGVNIRFSDQTVQWGTKCVPFKDQDSTPFDVYFVNEDEMEEGSARIQRILDAKYEAANINDVCAHQEQLDQVKKDKLKQVLLKYETLFDGTLGKWSGSAVELQLNEGATPCHARAFPVP